MTLYLADEAATWAFAARLAQHLEGLQLVTLQGNLGTGKTSLVRGILKALGFPGAVKSPTYTLVEPYQVNGRSIYHFDLYRLADPEELEYIGFSDFMDGVSLCLVEWPEKATGMLPTPDLEIKLNAKHSGREIAMTGFSEAGKDVAKSLKNDN